MNEQLSFFGIDRARPDSDRSVAAAAELQPDGGLKCSVHDN